MAHRSRYSTKMDGLIKRERKREKKYGEKENLFVLVCKCNGPEENFSPEVMRKFDLKSLQMKIIILRKN